MTGTLEPPSLAAFQSGFFMPFTRKLPSVSSFWMYVIDYVARVPTSGRILGMGCTGKSHTLDHLEYTMELIYCLYFLPYELVWCSILYVYRYAWAVINI